MTLQAVLYLVVLLALVLLSVKPVGAYIANVMEGRQIWIVRAGGKPERGLYRLCGIRPETEMGWKRYALAILVFNTTGVVVLYLMQRFQAWIPLNPQRFPAVSADSSFNTAVSFVGNTNWQGYAGEITMSYFTQLAGLAVQNFLSAATGIVVAVALFRGIARGGARTLGNAWVDLTRSTLYILIPLAAVVSLVLASQGVLQTFSAYKEVTLMEPLTYQKAVVDAAGNPVMQDTVVGKQRLPMGPIASQESIKLLGTNGGGFLNANSAHPFENPTPFTNILQILVIMLIPCALTYTFGRMLGDTRQGWAVLGAMGILYAGMTGLAVYQEQLGNPLIAGLGVDDTVSETQSGGSAPELLARIRTALRRHARGHLPTAVTRVGSMQLDLGRRRAHGTSGEVHFTPIECRVLECLVRGGGGIVTQEQMIREVWGPGREDDTRNLRVAIRSLRQKLEPDSRRPTYLMTEAGVGYRLRTAVEGESPG